MKVSIPPQLHNTITTHPNGHIARAITLATKAHEGQKRKSGEPYIVHPLAVGETLFLWGLDEATITAGILHDTVEDTQVTLEHIEKEFGKDIAFLVEGVTKISRIKYRSQKAAQVENLRKLILALSQDIRVVFIKLADRLHNMKTLAAVPPQKQKRIAAETDEIYAPLAYRLGMHQVSGDLQDLAFPYIHPKEYAHLVETVPAQYEARLKYLENFKPEVEKILHENNIENFSITFRAKRYSSLYKKLQSVGIDAQNASQLYDLVAMRIIVPTTAACYAALGAIHAHFPPLPGRIKDFIAMPKPNGYRSLHTTVFGPKETIIEFQIRTPEMHEENENGIAAHWLYKQAQAGKKSAHPHLLTQELTWVQQLKNWHTQMAQGKNASEILDTMKVEFFKDRIFAITPAGDVIDLPAAATPVDFAYHIHTELGNTCVAAKVNGVFVPLNHQLASGDMVEILAQKNKMPSEDWLEFVKTASARDRIRVALRHKTTALSKKRRPEKIEFRLSVISRVGLLKDITTIFARSHINITDVFSSDAKNGVANSIKIVCDLSDTEKAEKIKMKLKQLKEIREISFRLAN